MRRKLLAILLMPATLAFELAHRGWEWWHFGPSNALVHWFRVTDKRMVAWWDSK